MRNYQEDKYRSTTVLSVRKNGKVVMIADGQVTRGSTVVKGEAVKVRKINDKVLVGMAGFGCDCFVEC